MRRRIHPGAVIFGLIVVTLGVLFLLDTTGAAKAVFTDYWPVVLLLLGAWFTVQERGRGFFGPIVFLLGVGFLLQNLDVIGQGWIGRYWPVAIIVFGVVIVRGALRFRSGPDSDFLKAQATADEWLDAVAVLGGHKERVRSASWHGGRATAVMGGVELDLRDAHAAPEGAVLHVSTFMGGVSVTVPESWEVTMHGTPFLGGFEDKTRHGTTTEEASKLEITGTMVLGGVEVKN
jgi:predicted membrane protein